MTRLSLIIPPHRWWNSLLPLLSPTRFFLQGAKSSKKPPLDPAVGSRDVGPFTSQASCASSCTAWAGIRIIVGVDSFSILFNYRSFQNRLFLLFLFLFNGFLKRRIPGKNGEGTPRTIYISLPRKKKKKKKKKSVWMNSALVDS